MKILTLNAGSNSLKFEVIDQPNGDTGDFGKSLWAGSIDDIGKGNTSFSLLEGKQVTSKRAVDAKDHGCAASMVLNLIGDGQAETRGVQNLSAIGRIGHRIVHGGDTLTKTALITDSLLAQIDAWRIFAPYHTKSVRQVIGAAQSALGGSIPMYAVFDTAFHQAMPAEAASYALPGQLARRYRIRRYGFHGISHHFMSLRYAKIVKRPLAELKLVTLHLEGGSSAAAIRNGQSVDTSMGLTPLEGLMMGTRCGDLDPAAALHLMRQEKWSPDEVETFLNKRCGLEGVSGVSADTRILEHQLSNPAVELALRMFCYRVRKYIGAYLAVLEGADAIIFGGGIGEDSPLVREWICRGLGWCGAILDKKFNQQVNEREARISTAESAVAVWVVPTQEGLMMAREVADAQ